MQIKLNNGKFVKIVVIIRKIKTSNAKLESKNVNFEDEKEFAFSKDIIIIKSPTKYTLMFFKV